MDITDAHLKQKANSQATDKASAPSVCKAVVESGNMVTIRPGAVESKGTTVFSSSETDFAPFIREAYKHLGENNMKFYKMDNLCKLGYVAAEYLLKDTNYRPKGPPMRTAPLAMQSSVKCVPVMVKSPSPVWN